MCIRDRLNIIHSLITLLSCDIFLGLMREFHFSDGLFLKKCQIIPAHEFNFNEANYCSPQNLMPKTLIEFQLIHFHFNLE